jgi:hypothetical protein
MDDHRNPLKALTKNGKVFSTEYTELPRTYFKLHTTGVTLSTSLSSSALNNHFHHYKNNFQ